MFFTVGRDLRPAKKTREAQDHFSYCSSVAEHDWRGGETERVGERTALPTAVPCNRVNPGKPSHKKASVGGGAYSHVLHAFAVRILTTRARVDGWVKGGHSPRRRCRQSWSASSSRSRPCA